MNKDNHKYNLTCLQLQLHCWQLLDIHILKFSMRWKGRNYLDEFITNLTKDQMMYSGHGRHLLMVSDQYFQMHSFQVKFVIEYTTAVQTFLSFKILFRYCETYERQGSQR